jgi:asparagine synthase (glutamine-hydrolysing)
VELRHPFHDVRLTQFFMGVCGSLLRRKDNRKALLREAMRGTLPEMVRTRTTKAAFAGNIIDSLDGMLAARPARELLPVQLGWIDPERIEAMQASFSRWRREGSRGPLPPIPGGPVWFVLASDLWLRHAVGL